MRQTTEQRFFAKVQESGDCWIWTASRTLGGYGVFHGDGHHLAHRWVYEFMVAPIPPRLQLDHLCRTRECVNPYHLDPVTPLVNIRRSDGGGKTSGANKRAETHCQRGHQFNEANTQWNNGLRRCRVCSNTRSREYMRRNRAMSSA